MGATTQPLKAANAAAAQAAATQVKVLDFIGMLLVLGKFASSLCTTRAIAKLKTLPRKAAANLQYKGIGLVTDQSRPDRINLHFFCLFGGFAYHAGESVSPFNWPFNLLFMDPNGENYVQSRHARS
jgi:hypothetical protein